MEYAAFGMDVMLRRTHAHKCLSFHHISTKTHFDLCAKQDAES
jgi:hypothetical protein